MISVILNVYRRPHTLEKQIEAIKNQSMEINSENIHVWFNNPDINIEQFKPVDDKIKTYQCNWNTKFWGRFTIPLLVQTEYVAMFDDDIIPQKDWFKNCLDTINNPATNGILGGSGVIVKEKSYIPFDKIGWNGQHLNSTTRVDLVGHAWFFRQEWAKYLWYEKPYTWNNGEDIMFSYLAQKYGNVNTFVPAHPENNKNLWSCDFRIGLQYGNDENASWLKNTHYGERDKVVAYCIDNGWNSVNKVI